MHWFTNLRPTPMVLELVDRSMISPKEILEDVVISVDSWEYPVDFLVLYPKTKMGGHPLVLGRPWLATIDAYIGCRSGSMMISNGDLMKNLVLYPHSKPSVDHRSSLWS